MRCYVSFETDRSIHNTFIACPGVAGLRSCAYTGKQLFKAMPASQYYAVT